MQQGGAFAVTGEDAVVRFQLGKIFQRLAQYLGLATGEICAAAGAGEERIAAE